MPAFVPPSPLCDDADGEDRFGGEGCVKPDVGFLTVNFKGDIVTAPVWSYCDFTLFSLISTERYPIRSERLIPIFYSFSFYPRHTVLLVP